MRLSLPGGSAALLLMAVARGAFADETREADDRDMTQALPPLPPEPTEPEPEPAPALPQGPAAPPSSVPPVAASPAAPKAPPAYVPTPRPPLQNELVPPHINLDGTLGVGTPVGWLGVGASVRPSDLVALSVGAGLGSRGTQLATMLHAYPIAPSKRVRVGFGAGVSTGTFVVSSFRNIDVVWERYFQRAWFLNLQASAFAWNSDGLSIEPFAGYGIVLNNADGACAGWRSTCGGFNGVLFLGLTAHYGAWL